MAAEAPVTKDVFAEAAHLVADSGSVKLRVGDALFAWRSRDSIMAWPAQPHDLAGHRWVVGYFEYGDVEAHVVVSGPGAGSLDFAVLPRIRRFRHGLNLLLCAAQTLTGMLPHLHASALELKCSTSIDADGISQTYYDLVLLPGTTHAFVHHRNRDGWLCTPVPFSLPQGQELTAVNFGDVMTQTSQDYVRGH